jgi:hypothetical protein
LTGRRIDAANPQGPPFLRHHGAMTLSRSEADAALRQIALDYERAWANLEDVEQRAMAAARQAKSAGLSQHDIARILGPRWGSRHNPQFPPVTTMQDQPRE